MIELVSFFAANQQPPMHALMAHPHAHAEEARLEVVGDHCCAARTQLYHGTEAPNHRLWTRFRSIGVHSASGIRKSGTGIIQESRAESVCCVLTSSTIQTRSACAVTGPAHTSHTTQHHLTPGPVCARSKHPRDSSLPSPSYNINTSPA